jgi:hypothetical protein
MFESPRREELSLSRFVPPLGFFVVGLEIYAFIAARLALGNEQFIAPMAIIFFALDHTEFFVFIVVVICGVDLYLKPTPARVVIFLVALLPVILLIVFIVKAIPLS